MLRMKVWRPCCQWEYVSVLKKHFSKAVWIWSHINLEIPKYQSNFALFADLKQFLQVGEENKISPQQLK